MLFNVRVWIADALEAVKLDPAVLEAQVTVHSKEKAIDVAVLNGPEVVIENKKGSYTN